MRQRAGSCQPGQAVRLWREGRAPQHDNPRDYHGLLRPVRAPLPDHWRACGDRYGYSRATVDLDFLVSKTELGGVEVLVSSLAHLLALKLHVLKQDLPLCTPGALDVIINLVSINALDLREEHWRELFEKYGSPELYRRVRQAAAS
jgi:hypothetical protein